MPGPVDPRLLKRARATRTYLVAGVGVGSLTAMLAIAQAWLLSHAVVGVFDTHTLDGVWPLVAGLVGVFTARALLQWVNAWLAHRAAAAVKSQLRRDIMAARLARPQGSPTTSATLVTLLTQGLDALDGYFAKYLPQLALAVTVPVIVGVAILTADLTSTIIVALTLPLIPVFMALIGWATQARVERRWAVQTRLANHFADLVAGLPTLQVFGRAAAQVEGLRRTEELNRRETMATLRVSFLSALVLELLSTLSVALVAVFIGVRVVHGNLDFLTGLYVLILAPEVYLPVRQVGVHYHDAADGVAAAQAAFAEIEAAQDEATGTQVPGPGTPTISFVGLGHHYPGATLPSLEGLDLTVQPGEVVVLTGPSGGGKSTALHALMGFLSPTLGRIEVDGVPLSELDATAWRRRVAWVGQIPGTVAGDVATNVRLGAPDADDAAVRAVLDRAGADAITLHHPVGDEAEGLSAGERRRVAIARALLRIQQGGARVLVLDEPTAGLDSDAEAAVLEGVRASGASALVVSHRPAVLAAADRVVTVRVLAEVAR